MESFFLACLLIMLFVRWIILHNRLNRIDEQIAYLNSALAHPPQWARAPDLSVPAPVTAPPPPPRPPEPPPVHLHPMPPPPTPRVEVPRPVPPTPPPAPIPAPVQAEPPQPAAPPVDWEALLGGNLLNKAGVVLLVIGLSLAMAYSFAHIGPLGRVAISLAVSIAMLVSGVVFEPRERYRVFARGLLGGGWAGLYTTVYAMHAVKEALVIPDPVIGTVLLIAVATGMIVHSLRYRSQTVTGMAYFIAFGTLAIAETNILAAVALIPLAVSLLYIVHRFAWSKMPLLGLIATYSVIVIRGDHGTPLWQAQTLFAIFWLVFEAFDVLHPEAWLLPLNAAGFLGLSLLKWNSDAPHDVWMLLAAASAAYLVSAVVRWQSGKWHGAATLSAALAAAAIFQHFDHPWIAPALLIEAELAYLAGVRLKARYLRWLATALFALQIGRLLVGDMSELPLHTWTSVATLTALVFYANRAIEASDLFFGYVAAGLLALVIGNEAPQQYRSLEWLGLAAASLGLGWWRRLFDFRAHGYLLGILGLTAVAIEVRTNQPAVWGAFVLTYGLALASRYFPEVECDAARYAGGIAASLSALALLWWLVPAAWLGIAWMALALVWLELGILELPREFRLHSYVVAALGAFWVSFSHLIPLVKHDPVFPALAMLLAYALAARAWSIRQLTVYAAALAAGTIFLLNALWIAMPESAVAPLWAAVSLALFVAGLQWDDPVASAYAYIVSALAFIRCWGINFELHTQSVMAATIAAACFFTAQLLTPRGRIARTYYALLGAALITILLWYESTGSVLTVAWGVEGVALLSAGFPLRDRVLRLSGLALLMSCILKLFLWDLRHLDTLPRIFSFIVLGLILVGVSWIYTRFREHVERYL